MKRRHVGPVIAVTVLSALAAGCGALPGRFSPEQLERVGRELTNADSIYAELGPPDLRREDARIWIYTWEELIPYPSRSLVVLEFDADGQLANREVALAVKPTQRGLDGFSPSARYCTAGGTCIEHGIDADEGIRFEDSFSAVTVRGAAQARVRSPEPAASECQVVIWPGAGWRQSHSSIPPPDGLAVSIEGAAKWSYHRWLPVGAYARLVLPAGEHVLSVRDPMWDARMSDKETPPEDFTTEWWLDVILSPAIPPEETDRQPRAVTVQCSAGERIYLAIEATFKGKGQHWFPIELRPVDAAQAQLLMADLAQVLPPDY